MPLAVVLAAGGLVGVAHHIGVLRAIEEETGLHESDVSLMIGTSAGSAVAAYLRSGWTTSALMERVPDLAAAAAVTVSGSPIKLLRHGVGSAYLLARTTVRVPSLLSLTPGP
ncbi:MAG: patatin-like phospholipase family protein, partial [Acidimicrobiales bacterium]